MRDRIWMAAACLAAGLACSPAMAQCDTYTVAAGNTPFVMGTTDIGNHCDDCTTTLTLPFSVSVYGQSFTSVNVASNGNLQFGGTSASFTNVCLPTTTFTGPVILPFWDDLYTVTTGVGQGVFTALSGNPGSQQFVIEWRTQYCCSTAAFINDFEVIFYENQNFFDVVYGAPMSDRASATVGVQFSPTGPSTQVECNVAGPTAGQSYRFTCTALVPAACCNTTTGACTLVTQTNCAAPNSFNGGSTCGPNPCPQPPANDACTGARVVTSFPFADSVLPIASDDVDVACNAAANVATRAGVWYRYNVGSETNNLILGETGPNDVVIGVFTGTDCSNLTEVACFDTEANDVVTPTANTSYWFLVGMASATAQPTGTYQFTLTRSDLGACCNGSNCSLALSQASCTGTFLGANTTCGGPNTFRIATNTATFEDITATGTLLTALQCDDCSTNVTLPFTFNYLGTGYTTVSVSSNGYIQFGGTSSVFTNAPIPTPGVPDNFIAPLWDDFDIRTTAGTGNVYVLSDATRVVISWVGVGQYNGGLATTDQNSFQVVLRADGEVEFRYGSITAEATPGDYTVGFEDATGTSGASVPGASLGTGNTALLLTHTAPCTGGPTNGACCSGSTCSVTAPASCTGANKRFSGAAACNASGNNTTPCCRGDYNQSGTVTVQDIFDFLAGYFTQNPQADVNGVGGVTVQDIFDYLALYFTGC